MTQGMRAVALLSCCLALPAPAAENVFLITLDGLRWQELFSGGEAELVHDEAYTPAPEYVPGNFWQGSAEVRRAALMPFFWDTIAVRGTLIGNRLRGSEVNVSNRQWFSYPGYNEILTGFDDPEIVSNDRVPNRNVTVLEWVNRQPGFEGQVAAFASWEVFPWIINEDRSGVPVNAGFESASGLISERERYLNRLQSQTPSPFNTVRLDVFTHHFALEYLARESPRLLYIAYGETDDFAHSGDYRRYLDAAHRTDGFIRELWNFVQSDPRYRDRTTFVITTDHGRGSGAGWTTHDIDTPGADHIWVALLGPGIPARGELSGGAVFSQSQMAATVAELLGLHYRDRLEIGASILPSLD